MTLNEALNLKTENRIAAMKDADAKRAELHARIPRIKAIDDAVSEIPFRSIAGEDVALLREEAERLSDERARLLTLSGYPENYDAPKFECPDCNDGGYCGLKLCHCIKELMTRETYRESKLAGGLIDKTFESFSLSYYAKGAEYEKMRELYESCKKYAQEFPKDRSAGLLLMGGTGLGKTHISAAIANEIAARGISVIYESAQQIYDTLDAVRFNRLDLAERKKYEACSLLIIDDLGAECNTQYSVSALTSLIDLRIVNGKKTLISTNLNPAAIRKTYGERLFSRLIGEFRLVQFVGKDIRMQKIKGVDN